jgi:hypothetical protein
MVHTFDKDRLPVYYVGKATLTETSKDAYEDSNVKVGDIEWQFSDAPLHKRSVSYDFLTLEEGLRYLSPCIIVMEDK